MISRIAIALVLSASTLCVAQQKEKPSTSQQAGQCSINQQGQNDKASITCVGLDPKLANQLKQLVIAAKKNQDENKIISEKLSTILNDLNQPAIVVTSINQQGGITAGQVNITGGAAVKITFTQISANLMSGTLEHPSYESKIEVRIDGAVPNFLISAQAPSLTDLSLIPKEGGAVMMGEFGSIVNGEYRSLQNAFGTYILTLTSNQAEHFDIHYQC
jgi:hypothetical protein